MPEPESRLYNEEKARAFLGGRDPHKLCAPLRLWQGLGEI